MSKHFWEQGETWIEDKMILYNMIDQLDLSKIR